MPLQKETKGWETFILPALIIARTEIWKSLSHCSLSLASLKMYPDLMEINYFLKEPTGCLIHVPCLIQLWMRHGTSVSWYKTFYSFTCCV